MIKVGFVGNKESVSAYPAAMEQAFGAGGVDVKVDTMSKHPLQMGKRLLHWADEGFEAVVVLDEGIEDKEEMFSGIHYYLEKSKIEHETRVIFVASAQRLSSDEDICALAYEGVYDLVLPFKGDDPVATAIEFIRKPATASNVRYVVGSGAKVFRPEDYEARHPELATGEGAEEEEVSAKEDSREEVEGARREEESPREDQGGGERSLPEELADSYEERPLQPSVPIPGQIVIAVTSLSYRGGSTTLAFHIAVTIAQALARHAPQRPKYHMVAVVTGRKTFEAMRGVYGKRFEVVDERCGRFMGYDVFVGCTPGVAGRNYSHVILDCGWITDKKSMMSPEEEEMRQILEYRCQLPVMAVPMGSSEDIQAFVALTKEKNDISLKRMSYVLWGSSEDLANQAKDAIRAHWPAAWIEAMGWVARPEIPGREIDPQIMELLEPYIDVECMRAYKSSIKRKAKNAEEGKAEGPGEGDGDSSPSEEGETQRRSLLRGIFSRARK